MAVREKGEEARKYWETGQTAVTDPEGRESWMEASQTEVLSQEDSSSP